MKLRAKLSVFVLLALAMCSLLSSASAQSASAAWVDKSPHKSGFVQANGVQLHYLDWGGHGETLLFLAGLGHSAHVFDDLAQKFTNHFRVLAMTRRGFGLSDKPESGYDVETRVADLLGFLDALHIQRVTLAGHSIAGDELTAFAAAHPQRVDKLIYLDAAFDRSNNPIAKAVREGKAQPPPPPSIPKEALASVDAYRTFQQKRLVSAWSPAMEARHPRFDPGSSRWHRGTASTRSCVQRHPKGFYAGDAGLHQCEATNVKSLRRPVGVP